MAAPGKGAPVGSSGDFHQGERIGKYQIITQLSVGGMAELFLGFTSGPGGFRKYVAIKRILPDVRSNESFERMFLDEARITAAFNHPNIAQVYELGQEADGLFLAMEFVAGQNLDQVTSAFERLKKPIPLGLSVAVMRDVCLALHYAHTFTDPSGRPGHVIHRDVAQKNIMVTYDGVVKLLDFGIAKARNSLERTRTGMVKGTSGYMSPEQVRGDKLDARSDLFSVGVVLWEMVTGDRLFSARTEREEMVSILQAPIPAPRHPTESVSRSLSEIILKALERDPEKRFQSGKELARALEQAAGSVLYDSDRCAAVMRELFEKKMANTRALLESADSSSTETEPMPVEPSRKVEPPKKKAPLVPGPARGGDTMIYEEKASSAKADTGTMEEARSATTDEARAPTTRPAPATQKDATPGGRALNTVLWVAVVASILLGGGYLAMTLTRALDSEVLPQPEVKALTDPRLGSFPEPGQPGVPASAAVDAGTPAGGTAVAEAKGAQDGKGAQGGDKEAAGGKEGEDKPSKSNRRPQGVMTLIIIPEAEVFLGKRSLGRTPLFSKPMPEGTHLLRIVGADGKKRRLSVPIKAGELAKYRFSLTDIPEAR